MAFDIKKFKFILILLTVILIPLLFGQFIPEIVKAFFYSISLTIKNILTLALPFIIFSFIFSALLSLGSNSIKLVFLLIIGVFISNFIAIMTGFSIGSFLIGQIEDIDKIVLDNNMILKPLWEISFPNFISNKIALITGFILGMIFSIKKYRQVDNFGKTINHLANSFLKIVFSPLIPFFILGFIFKLDHEQILGNSLKAFGPFFFVIFGTQLIYMFSLYFIGSGFITKETFRYLKNILPAFLTGFSTVSSVATLPVLIVCSEKNVSHQMASTIVPSTINIHTLGSAISMSILTVVTMKMYGYEVNLQQYFVFAFYYALGKYAVATVPGGLLVVVIPIVEMYLGFNPEMIGILSAMYLLYDPFGTAMNVTGNGAFVIIFEKIYKKFIVRVK